MPDKKENKHDIEKETPWFSWLPTIFGLFAMYLAYSPNITVDIGVYRDFAFLFFIAGLISLFFVFMASVINLLRRKWLSFGINLLGFIFGFLALVFALVFLGAPMM